MTTQYEQYLYTINKYIESYFEAQKPFIHCKKGCSLCCQNGEFPASEIEFQYLNTAFKNLPLELQILINKNINKIKEEKKHNTHNKKFTYQCPFLINDECACYQNRPLICRSYGLITIYDDEQGKQCHALPYCIDYGLNYSEVYDKESETISSKKWEALKIEIEPNSYNVGINFLLNNEITNELGLKLGKQKPLIDWL